MKEAKGDEKVIHRERALNQFFEVYRYFSANSIVQLLPTPKHVPLQDLVFTANLGIVLTHIKDKDVVIISNFTSEPRQGETRVGNQFFELLGYEVHVCPYKFEGEAELKHLYENVYIGGYGIRTDIKALEWMEENFDMKIIKIAEVDEYLYHLDCSVFPLTKSMTMVATEMLEKKEVKEIEQYTGIIDVSADDCYSGITNSVRLYNMICNASNIHSLKAGTEKYNYERNKNVKLENIVMEYGMEVVYFDLSEFLKGGALLSCMVMHLNRESYKIELI